MSTQQFVKNTNTPSADSELYSVADGWKISAGGNIYTNLDEVFRTNNDHAFYDALVKQLNGEIKESLDIGLKDHLFVASYSQNEKALVYAFLKKDKDKADKKASYNGSVQKAATPTQEPQQKITQAPSQLSGQTTSIPIPFTKSSQLIEVPYAIEPIAWNDAMAIESAEAEGKFVLPVKFTGVENWGFNIDNTKTFYYGKIKLVRIQEE